MTTPHPPPPPPPPLRPPQSLPTARQFLTSLFNAISEIPLLAGGRDSNPDDGSTDDEEDDNDNEALISGQGQENQIDDASERRRLSRRERRMRRMRLLLLDEDGHVGHHSRNQAAEGMGAGNVLKQVPLSHRHLIITLHVLFPGLVLPALDLLDRGLVGRIVLRAREKTDVKMEEANTTRGVMKKEEEEEEVTIKKEQEQRQGQLDSMEGDTTSTAEIKTEDDDDDDDKGGDGAKRSTQSERPVPVPVPISPASFYLVRSAQPSHHRARRRQGPQNQRYGSVVGGEEDWSENNNNASNNLFPGGQRAYIVRLDAWNCTCAAFAFASFPMLSSPGGDGARRDNMKQEDSQGQKEKEGHESGSTVKEKEPTHNTNPVMENQEDGDIMDIDTDQPLSTPQAEAQDGEEEEDEIQLNGEREGQWTFGGMSLDRKVDGYNGADSDGENPPPPLCKHLLACLLAERWSEALNRYVVERQVSKEEMAGIVAEI